jgi:hypothetical protein
MQCTTRLWPILSAALLLSGLSLGTTASHAANQTADTPAAATVPSTWQHHKVRLNYTGFTAFYTCDGLEDRVRQILLHFGARKDLKVFASGCSRGLNAPSRNAWVDADFYALAPVTAAGAAADSATAGAVKAQWTALELTPQRPDFMGSGDCELIAEMKDLMIKNFSLRGLEYRTSCVPHEVVLNGFSVKGEVLKVAQQKSGTVEG